MQYTLRDLFDNLEITLTELSRRSGISDVTLISVRNGKSARRSTINTLLRVFSDIYGVKLTLKNVDGIIIQGKPVSRPIPNVSIVEKPKKTPVLPQADQHKGKEEKASKRLYNRKQDTSLSDGCILASKFAENHGVKRPTFIEHMTRGLGPGLIGMSTDTIPQRDQVEYSERPKPGRPKEKEKYLTREQQGKALDFWERHKVKFALCKDESCICHELFEIR